ncbi:MAG: hypothetical protein ACKV2T_29510 [Kofleriaceae bacterium]
MHHEDGMEAVRRNIPSQRWGCLRTGSTLLLLGLFGCDTVFGLGDRPQDAGFDMTLDMPDGAIDASDDAPLQVFECPIGGPLQFDRDPIAVIGGCTNYTTSSTTNTALMTCGGVVSEGPIGAGTSNAVLITLPAGETALDPRLAPSGDLLFARSVAIVSRIRAFRRGGNSWAIEPASTAGLPMELATNVNFASPPSASPDRRLMLHRGADGATVFTEYRDNAGTWTMVRDYQPNDLGVGTFEHPNMTPDGLHLVYIGATAVGGANKIWHATRASTATPFDAPVIIDVDSADLSYPHLAADCSRLYFNSFGTVVQVARKPSAP